MGCLSAASAVQELGCCCLDVSQANSCRLRRSQLQVRVLYSADCAITDQPKTGSPPAQVAIMPGAMPVKKVLLVQTERSPVGLQPVLPIQHGQQALQLRAASGIVQPW